MRSLATLINDVEYKDMTSEEINAVIEFKAQELANKAISEKQYEYSKAKLEEYSKQQKIASDEIMAHTLECIGRLKNA